MQSLFILGRQPAIGLAELEGLYGAEAIKRVGAQAATVDIEPTDIDFDRLGGATKFARVMTTLKTTEWSEVEKYLIRESPKHAQVIPDGKLTIGLSVYGFRIRQAAVLATGLSIKKAIRRSGRPVRLVPNKELELNTAQVIHNRLTDENSSELLIILDGTKTVIAQTLQVQDIESYTVRDRERPMRDARVGMLPPKLAQILINLAVGHLPAPRQSSEEYMEDEPDQTRSVATPERPTILDPFCGTGVVLQEALLTGYAAYGSDLDPRMVEYSKKNIEWLKTAFAFENLDITIEQGDATKHQWKPLFSHVACETYLGRPFTSTPHQEVLNQTISECNVIIKKFLANLHPQLPDGARMCVAVPAWQVRPGKFKHLPLLTDRAGSTLDSLENMGYNRMSFEHARQEDLLYFRFDQIVARELLVLVKK